MRWKYSQVDGVSSIMLYTKQQQRKVMYAQIMKVISCGSWPCYGMNFLLPVAVWNSGVTDCGVALQVIS